MRRSIAAAIALAAVATWSLPAAGFVKTSSDGFPPWYALKARIQYCKSAPLGEMTRDGIIPTTDIADSPTFAVIDTVLGPTRMSKRAYCKQYAILQPDPTGDLAGGADFTNGRVVVSYFERLPDGSQGAPVDAQTAKVRIDAQRAAERIRCKSPERPPDWRSHCASRGHTATAP
jgi:hypothetical protein